MKGERRRRGEVVMREQGRGGGRVQYTESETGRGRDQNRKERFGGKKRVHLR